jgi:hypothetical protein
MALAHGDLNGVRCGAANLPYTKVSHAAIKTHAIAAIAIVN